MAWEESGSCEATVIVQEERGSLEIWTKATGTERRGYMLETHRIRTDWIW